MQSEMQNKNLFKESPSWVESAIVYQIFPDRFRQSGRVEFHQHCVLQCWGSNPSRHGFCGGDLYGVIEALDLFEEMGINCIYLNPVFCSAANHRYHTFDYFQVDPLLGGNPALDELILALQIKMVKNSKNQMIYVCKNKISQGRKWITKKLLI